MRLLKIQLSCPCYVFNFAAGTLADIAANVNHVNRVHHVNLPFVHVVQHLLDTFGPDFLVTAMDEQQCCPRGLGVSAFRGTVP